MTSTTETVYQALEMSMISLLQAALQRHIVVLYRQLLDNTTLSKTLASLPKRIEIWPMAQLSHQLAAARSYTFIQHKARRSVPAQHYVQGTQNLRHIPPRTTVHPSSGISLIHQSTHPSKLILFLPRLFLNIHRSGLSLPQY